MLSSLIWLFQTRFFQHILQTLSHTESYEAKSTPFIFLLHHQTLQQINIFCSVTGRFNLSWKASGLRKHHVCSTGCTLVGGSLRHSTFFALCLLTVPQYLTRGCLCSPLSLSFECVAGSPCRRRVLTCSHWTYLPAYTHVWSWVCYTLAYLPLWSLIDSVDCFMSSQYVFLL